MRHFRAGLLGTWTALFAVAAGAAAGPGLVGAAVGKAAYATCAACHGLMGTGNISLGAPNIAGLDGWYVERQLKNYAAGLRGTRPGDAPGAAMRAAASVLATDGDRAMVALYIASLPRSHNTQNRIAPTPTANGQNYFNALCSACHGSNGHGNQTLGAPRLAGSDAKYLARQIAAFKSGQRGAVSGDIMGGQMRAIAVLLPDARTELDVIAYAATLP